jgi:predicted transcriptional regulator
MKSSGFVFTSQRGDINLSRLVNCLTAFETVLGTEEPHYRLMILMAAVAGASEPITNTQLHKATGWHLTRIQAFLDKLKEMGIVAQTVEGRTVYTRLTPEGERKAIALTELIQSA